jgi:ribonuclease P protein component
VAQKFTLGKTERLKSRKAIEQLFHSGRSFVVSPYRVMFMGTEKGALQFGTGVSAKNFKRAVDRNRIKRLTREAYRLQKNPLEQQLKESRKGMHLFVTYTGMTLPEYTVVYDSMQKIINKLLKIADENTTPDP